MDYLGVNKVVSYDHPGPPEAYCIFIFSHMIRGQQNEAEGPIKG